MKRIFLLLICLFFAAAATSCGESVNMGTLTEYQNGGFSAEIKISTGGRDYRADVKKSGGRIFVSVKEPSSLSAFTFALDEGGACIISGGTEIPIGGTELLRLARIYPLFSVSVAGTWKIEKARPGGVSLYVCESEDITLYIDANSHMPLKIICGETEADVLSFEVLA